MRPIQGLGVTLISDQVDAPYSGMFPGFLAGKYSYDEIHFDLRRTCRNTGARFIRARVCGLDLEQKKVILEDRPPIRYDWASINVGSEPDMSMVKGQIHRLIPMKPIYRFITFWDQFQKEMNDPRVGPLEVAMVGGGASGIEVSLAIMRQFGQRIKRFSLFQSQKELLPEHNSHVRGIFLEQLKAQGVEVHLNFRVVEVGDRELIGESGEVFTADRIFWATRAGAKDWLGSSGLPTDERGFLQVEKSLQVRGRSDLFGAGDCIRFADKHLPKSGVFAVREGPVLAANIRVAVSGGSSTSLIKYRPQSRSLALITSDEGKAVASYGPFWAQGPLIWKLKDFIDRRFMKRFFLHSPLLAMDKGDLPRVSDQEYHSCGGCGAKVGPKILQEALSAYQQDTEDWVVKSFEDGADGAAIQVPEGKWLVCSTDSLRDFCDDPYLFGQLSAIHALNDILVMGAMPWAASIDVQVDHTYESQAAQELESILLGLRSVFVARGVSLLGGHTSFGAERRIGFHVMGLVNPSQLRAKTNLREGDALILTKPLGTGVLLVGQMQGKAKGRWLEEMFRSMSLMGDNWAQLFSDFDIRAVTDVSGFGLCRHLWEMNRLAQLRIEVNLSQVPVLPGVRPLLEEGLKSPLAKENRQSMETFMKISPEITPLASEVLFDPQTCGGFLLAVSPQKVEELLKQLSDWGMGEAKVIGRVDSGPTGIDIVR